jgi:hypothetical protein
MVRGRMVAGDVSRDESTETDLSVWRVSNDDIGGIEHLVWCLQNHAVAIDGTADESKS